MAETGFHVTLIAYILAMLRNFFRPMDYRTQPDEFIEKLTPLQRYLSGRPHDDVPHFQFDGGANPLKDWCAQHGVPAVRHYYPES